MTTDDLKGYLRQQIEHLAEQSEELLKSGGSETHVTLTLCSLTESLADLIMSYCSVPYGTAIAEKDVEIFEKIVHRQMDILSEAAENSDYNKQSRISSAISELYNAYTDKLA